MGTASQPHSKRLLMSLGVGDIHTQDRLHPRDLVEVEIVRSAMSDQHADDAGSGGQRNYNRDHRLNMLVRR